MYDIKDMRIYLHRMQKSVLDKMFFADKVFEPVEAVRIFWQRIFHSGFKYVTIRDMMLSESASAPAAPEDIRRVRENARYAPQLAEYEAVWGPIVTRHDLCHYLLKYTYTQSWDREVRENDFPVTIEDIRAMIPAHDRINWQQHTPLRVA